MNTSVRSNIRNPGINKSTSTKLVSSTTKKPRKTETYINHSSDLRESAGQGQEGTTNGPDAASDLAGGVEGSRGSGGSAGSDDSGGGGRSHQRGGGGQRSGRDHSRGLLGG